MKRLFSLLLVFILLTTFLPVLAEEESDDLTYYFDSFASRVGHIYFTMDRAPDAVLHDEDLDRSAVGDAFEGICIGWKDKQQLLYWGDEREWQYHIADISGTIAEVREVFAGQDEMYIRGNALVHFAALALSFSGAEPEALDPKLTKKILNDVTLPMVTINFEYDDLPGVPYRCIGLLDGDMAVLLIGNVCAAFDAMADTMGIITPEQEAVIAERCVPSEEELGLLTFTMPAQTGFYFKAIPHKRAARLAYVFFGLILLHSGQRSAATPSSIQLHQTKKYIHHPTTLIMRYCLKPGSMTIACFTDAYHMVTVEYMPMPLNEMLGVETVTDDDLLNFVAALDEGSFETGLMRPGVACVKMIVENPSFEYAEPSEVWFILMPFGCYTITMPLTADGDLLRGSLAVKADADVYERDFTNELLYTIFGGELDLDE